MDEDGAEEAFLSIRLADALGRRVIEIVEATYPSEGCGLGLVPRGDDRIFEVIPIANEARGRSSRDAFVFEPKDHLRALLHADARGLEPGLVFHSHCDAPAYFSESDRRGALYDGDEVVPQAVHLVVSVASGRAVDAAAYAYRPTRGDFVEVRLQSWVTRLRGKPRR